MSLVKDEILVPTKDAPELAYVIESTDDKYVPDVFFKEMDKYKNEIKKVSVKSHVNLLLYLKVTQVGRPLPVEYLLIDVPVSSPLQPLATFSILGGDRKNFPVGNRLLESSLQVFSVMEMFFLLQFLSLQDFNSFAQYMAQFRSAEFLTAVSDIHVLVFMATLDIMPLRY